MFCPGGACGRSYVVVPLGLPGKVLVVAAAPVASAVLPIGDILANLVATLRPSDATVRCGLAAKTFESSQRPSLRPSAAIVPCGQRPQQLRGHS